MFTSNPQLIFVIQFLTSTLVYLFLFKIYVIPFLKKKSVKNRLVILTLPHLIRHLGLTLLIPGIVTGDKLNQNFAFSTAIGDYITLILGIMAICGLEKNWSRSYYIAFVFNIVGLIDIIIAGIKGFRYQVIFELGPQWYVVNFWVPLLLVTHFISIIFLLESNYHDQRK